MPRMRGKLNRQNLPSGQDGQVLVLDTHTPNGIAWRSGTDRVVTDITPELSGTLDCNNQDLTNVGDITFAAVTNEVAGIESQNLVDKSAPSLTGNVVMNDNSVTGVDTVTFTDVAGTIAGIQNQNLVDKSAPSFTGNAVMNDNSVTGVDTITFTDVAGTVAGIQNQNLVDKSATETVSGAWTFGPPLATASLADECVTERQTATMASETYAGTFPIIMQSFVYDSSETVDVVLSWNGAAFKDSSHATNAFAPLFRIDHVINSAALDVSGIVAGGTSGTISVGTLPQVNDIINMATPYGQQMYAKVTSSSGSDFDFTPALAGAVGAAGGIRTVLSSPLCGASRSTTFGVRGDPYGAVGVERSFSFTATEKNVPAIDPGSIHYYRFMFCCDANSIWQVTRMDVNTQFDMTVIKR